MNTDIPSPFESDPRYAEQRVKLKSERDELLAQLFGLRELRRNIEGTK